MSPGDESFTTALIWALEELLKSQRRFTVAQLSRKIREAPNFPKDQVPVQLDRCYRTIERMVLAPLAKTDENTEATSNDPKSTEDNQGHLSLNFVLDKAPSTSIVVTLAKALHHAMRKHELPVKRIAWGGFQLAHTHMYYQAARMFQEGISRKKARRNSDRNVQMSTIGSLTQSSSTG